MQDLLIALQKRYVAGKDSVEVVLEASKKAIQRGVRALWRHEIVMSNFLDLIERATFSPEGSAHDKNLKSWIENMEKIGSEGLFPTTAANVNEATRVLMRERKTTSLPLNFSVVWDQVSGGFHMSVQRQDSGVENLDAALQLLTDSKPASALMAQVRQPLSN